jgi:hypothetical protein
MLLQLRKIVDSFRCKVEMQFNRDELLSGIDLSILLFFAGGLSVVVLIFSSFLEAHTLYFYTH